MSALFHREALASNPEEARPSLAIRLFGSLEVEQYGLPIPRPRSRTELWLLALLLLHHRESLDRSRVAGLLWMDSTESRALENLRRSLSNLREALGSDAYRLFSPTPRTISLDLSGAFCDVLAFDAAIARGDPASLETAVALYRGPLLAGCEQEWAAQERESRQVAQLAAMEGLASQRQEEGRTGEAVRLLQQATESDPFRETAHRGLMQALASAGDTAAGLLVYRELRQRLREELRTEPDAATTSLFHQLRAGCIGPHASPNLQRPPPDVQRPTPLRSLPHPLSRLIGRQEEIARLLEVLGIQSSKPAEQECEYTHISPLHAFSPSPRLLTLTGPGGVGKTRLAIEVAREAAASFLDGICFVDLTRTHDPDALGPVLAGALGVQAEPGEPLLDTISRSLRGREMLVFLDNCEHLLDACAAAAERLLLDCPSLTILATSRQPLGISGETTWPVPPLSLPPDGEPRGTAKEHLAARALDSPAVQLFMDRAHRARPEVRQDDGCLPVIVEICRKLDGLPLAIELAAAQVRSASLEEIAERLADRLAVLTRGSRTVARHESLYAALDWSYELLTGHQRALFRRLAVFSGGWTLEMAEGVCSIPLPADSGPADPVQAPAIGGDSVLHLLSDLVERSLVVFEEEGPRPRYRYLEAVRQYAEEKLRDSGEAARLRRRHLACLVRLARQAEPQLAGPKAREWLDLLEVEQPNLFAALDRCASLPGGAARGARLVYLLDRFWYARSHPAEVQRQIDRLMSAPGALSLLVQMRLTAAQGTLAAWAGDPASEQYLARSLALAEARRDERAMAASLGALGDIAHLRGDNERAAALHRRSLELARHTQNLRIQSAALSGLGNAAKDAGRYEEALEHYRQSIQISRDMQDHSRVAMRLVTSAVVRLSQGHLEDAQELLNESLALARRVEDRIVLLRALLYLSIVHLCREDLPAAERCHAEAEGLAEKLGDRQLALVAQEVAVHLAAVRGDVARARAEASQYAREIMRLPADQEKFGAAFAFARVAMAADRPLLAARLMGAADAAAERFGARPFRDRPDYLALGQRIRAALNQAELDTAWQEGRLLTREEILRFALDGTL